MFQKDLTIICFLDKRIQEKSFFFCKSHVTFLKSSNKDCQIFRLFLYFRFFLMHVRDNHYQFFSSDSLWHRTPPFLLFSLSAVVLFVYVLQEQGNFGSSKLHYKILANCYVSYYTSNTIPQEGERKEVCSEGSFQLFSRGLISTYFLT